MEEEWRDIQGYDGWYQVSNKGRVRSFTGGNRLWGRKEPRIMKCSTPLSYKLIRLYKNKNSKMYRVARLVAKTFIPNPENKPEVNHINGIKDDDRVSNLEWVTRSENVQHAFDTGLKTCRGEKNSQAVLSKDDVQDIRNAYRLGCFTQSEIGQAYGVRQDTISRIITKDTWSHI